MLVSGGDPPMPIDVAQRKRLRWNGRSGENILMGGSATKYKDALSFARYLDPDTVRMLAPKLVPRTVRSLAADIDADLLDYLARQYRRLRDWYAEAVSAGEGMLIYAT